MCAFSRPRLYRILQTSSGNGVDTDQVVTVSSKQDRSIRRPGEASADRNLSKLGLLRAERIDNNLALEVPDLDAIIGGGTQPVTVGGKDEGVDDLTGLERVETLSLVEVPQHGGAVLSSRSTETAIRRNADRVEVASVANEVVAELAVGQGPDLDETVPSGRDNEGDSLRRAEPDTRDPLAVTGLGSANGVLALSEGVPQLDGLVTGSGHDLTVVHRKGHTEDILLVADKATGGLTGVDLPQTESSVPRSTQRELAIRRNDDIGHKVGVATEGTAGIAIGIILARVGERPDKDRLVARRRQDKVRVLRCGGDGGDPVSVTLEGSAKHKGFGHGD